MVPQVDDAAWIQWISRQMGIGAQPAPQFPPDRFYCVLDDQPDHLLSAWAMAEIEAAPPVLLLINPHCCLTRDGGIPRALANCPGLQESFALNGTTIAWVYDPVREQWSPFWLGHELSSWLKNAGPGSPEPSGLPQRTRALLASAGILIPANDIGVRRRNWYESALRAREAYSSGYATVPGLIHPFHLAAMRRYYRRLTRAGGLTLGDEQVSRRYGMHNEPLARFFHHQLAAMVTDLVGEPVKPSYVYCGAYQSGSVLKKHTDRAQCEFSITMCIDYSPEPVGETNWPIHLDTSKGRVTVHQRIGDALLYRGCRVPHYRDVLPEGHSSTSIFFHYVRQNFDGVLD
jgi:hypothetical protein